jgi:hypothetical protein
MRKDFFGPKMALAIVRAKKVSGPSKNLDFVPGQLEPLSWPHLVIWQGRFDNTTHIYSTVALIVNLYPNF